MKKEITNFKTWWSKNNVATIITINNNSYSVFLGVIDRKPNNTGKIENNEIFIFPTNHNDTKWGIYSREGHDLLRNARAEASWLQKKLDSDNPILCIHPLANSYNSFTSVINSPYVKFYNSLPYNNKNWDNYLKPFSVIRVRKKEKTFKVEFYHVGVYLGDNQVCHIYDYGEEKLMEARITHIDTFLGDTSTTERCGGVDAYQPVIPFGKNIAQRIAWADEVKYRKGEYELFNRNCVHFAHMMVFWINYCDQSANQNFVNRSIANLKNQVWNWKIIIKPLGWFAYDIVKSGWKSSKVNNGKGETICLRNEISGVSDEIKKLDNWRSEELEERYEASIEAPIKTSDCNIM